ncbi:MAG: DUF503 domain-containing protein [Myxococcales bacterium]|nr:DUF503 domain-containing protein [Myxococcales bacterium]MCB9643086.1 DUF503 domain-containing protein [Myxococcales bacterium]
MVVGVCRLSLYLQGIRSLKGKRQIVRRITERVRNRFQVAIAEVADQDLHQRATIGLAVVGNQQRFVQTRLSTILQAIESMQLGLILQPQIEFAHYGEDFGHHLDYASVLSSGSEDALSEEDDEEDDWSDDWDLDAEEAALNDDDDDGIPAAWRDAIPERDKKP